MGSRAETTVAIICIRSSVYTKLHIYTRIVYKLPPVLCVYTGTLVMRTHVHTHAFIIIIIIFFFLIILILYTEQQYKNIRFTLKHRP